MIILDDDIETVLIPEEKLQDQKYRYNFVNYPKFLDINNEHEKSEYIEYANKYGEQAAKEYFESLIDEKDKNSKNDKLNDDKKDDDEINLSTSSFISPITKEKIDLDNMSVYDKISEIYYHTGITVKVGDPVLMRGYKDGFNSFSSFLSDLEPQYTEYFQSKMGPNWQDQLLNGYSEGWEKGVNKVIGKEKDRANERLRQDLTNAYSYQTETNYNVSPNTSDAYIEAVNNYVNGNGNDKSSTK